MFAIFNKINVNSATVFSALMQKANNETLSPKTLNKLVRVANTDVGLNIKDAQRLFKENKPIATTIHSQKLVFQLRRVAGEINNPTLSSKIENWIRNCNSTTVHYHSTHFNYGQVSISRSTINQQIKTPTNSHIEQKNSNAGLSFEEFICQYYSRIGPEIGKGGEAFVVEDKTNPSKVLKIFLDSSATSEIKEQAELFNKFYGDNSAVVLSNRAIEMSRVPGIPMSKVENFNPDAKNKFMSLMVDMIAKGCPPNDLSEGNFLYDVKSGLFYPVDIGKKESDYIDQGGLQYLLDFIDSKTE
ncbi:hypothetical protein NVI2019_PEGOAJLN_03848 (plasmid) [Providencia alcalifaciens]|uniref:OspG family effector kinase n=1 Tax=Providencia alcalifaciens TaxID=126385 RepID=UPI001CC71997|nr:hypothetical protein [Providencia alcalifaciens]CAG9436185.1 hypothetical protein NVI2019_PEGOAJLN_03848 [Providencia alcalifaciens]